MKRSGSVSVLTNGRSASGSIGQNINRNLVTNRSQLEPSPQELPVKDTDRAIDVASAECKSMYRIEIDRFHFHIIRKGNK